MTSTTLPRSRIAGLSAIIAGNGPPVLLLHGVGLQAEACSAQIEAFRVNHKVIAPDMPGHGQSECPDRSMELADYADAIQQVLETLSNPAIVIGHSMGAMIALELAFSAPERIYGVAALNAIFERSPSAKSSVKSRAKDLDGTSVPDPSPTLARWFGNVETPERAACSQWLSAADPKGYKLAYTAFANANGPSRAMLKSLECPILFATGALEPNSTPEMTRRMAELAPNGRAMIIKDAAHMMPMTHAARLNAALLEFAKDSAA